MHESASTRSLSTEMNPALKIPGTKAGRPRVTPPSVTSTDVSRIMIRAIAITIMCVGLALKRPEAKLAPGTNPKRRPRLPR